MYNYTNMQCIHMSTHTLQTLEMICAISHVCVQKTVSDSHYEVACHTQHFSCMLVKELACQCIALFFLHILRQWFWYRTAPDGV